jgi:hypothetical protein
VWRRFDRNLTGIKALETKLRSRLFMDRFFILLFLLFILSIGKDEFKLKIKINLFVV